MKVSMIRLVGSDNDYVGAAIALLKPMWMQGAIHRART
jgi:hypothetical protein